MNRKIRLAQSLNSLCMFVRKLLSLNISLIHVEEYTVELLMA